MEEARIFRSMPLVHRAFKTLADHVPQLIAGKVVAGNSTPSQEPPMHFEQHELHGNLMKGFFHGTLQCLEVMLHPTRWFVFQPICRP